MNDTLIKRVKSDFISKFVADPILVFSPGRINLIGEHTDYNNGFVFPAAIDKGIVAAIYSSDENFSSAVAIDMNEQFNFSLNNIKPLKNGGWRNFVLGIVSEIQEKGKQIGNFNIVFGGDIPSGSGLSSSASLENSIVYSLNELFQLGFTKEEMTYISQKAEHKYVGIECGIMDSYIGMFGVENTALLLDCKTLKAVPNLIDFKEYQLLLLNSNVSHSLAESAYNDRRSVCEKIAKKLGISSLREASEDNLLEIKSKISDEDYQKILYVIQENKRVKLAAKAIKEDNLIELGNMIYQSHNGLQNQYKVSCPELDFLVEQAKKEPDVIGARMMGGGFGGCTINLIKKSAVEKFVKNVSELYHKKFNIKCSPICVSLSKGTHIVG